MIAKLFYLWLSLAKFSLEQLFIQFDVYDVVHIVFLGALGVCLRIFDRRQRNALKRVRSSLRSPASPGKKRGSVSFAAGTKFYPIQSYTPLNWTLLRNVSAVTSTMSDTWKQQRSSLKISLTTDDGEEVSTEGEAKGRRTSHSMEFPIPHKVFYSIDNSFNFNGNRSTTSEENNMLFSSIHAVNSPASSLPSSKLMHGYQATNIQSTEHKIL